MISVPGSMPKINDANGSGFDLFVKELNYPIVGQKLSGTNIVRISE